MLNYYLERCLAALLGELACLTRDQLAAVEVSSLVARLPQPVAVQWDAASRGPIEAITRRASFVEVGPFAPAESTMLSVPIVGDPELLRHRASRWSTAPVEGVVAGDRLNFYVVARSLSVEVIGAELARVRRTVDQRAGWANADLEAFRSVAEQRIHAEVARLDQSHQEEE